MYVEGQAIGIYFSVCSCVPNFKCEPSVDATCCVGWERLRSLYYVATCMSCHVIEPSTTISQTHPSLQLIEILMKFKRLRLASEPI